jgi:hypothetical protein
VRKKRDVATAGLDEDTPSRQINGNVDLSTTLQSNSGPTDDVQYPSSNTTSRSAWLPVQYDVEALTHRDLTSPPTGILLDPALQSSDAQDADIMSRESSSGDNNIAFDNFQNPSDALGILAQIASNGDSEFDRNVFNALRPFLIFDRTATAQHPTYGQSLWPISARLCSRQRWPACAVQDHSALTTI